MRSWLLIAFVAALFFSFNRVAPNEGVARELTQIEFYKALDEGKIVEPVVRVLDRDEGETCLSGVMETDPGYCLPESRATADAESMLGLHELPHGRRLTFTVEPRNCYGATGAPLRTTWEGYEYEG